MGEGKYIGLLEIARVDERERTPDSFSRLNGKKAAGISVMGSSGADLRKLSRNIKKEMKNLGQPLEFTVLFDRGAEEAAAFHSVFGAALQGAIMVGFISFLLNRKKIHGDEVVSCHAGLFCALAVPGICLVSAALLTVCGFSPDRMVLAGIASGIGAAVDSVILCSEKLRKCKNYRTASAALGELRGPLVSGALTTTAALLPLAAMDRGEAGIIARAIAAVTLTALLLSLTLLPPLLLWDSGSIGVKNKIRLPVSGSTRGLKPALMRCIKIFCRRLFRLGCKFLAANVKLCIRYPLWIICAGIVLSAAAAFSLFVKGTDPGTYHSGDSVYARVEFEGGLLAEEADRLLAEYGETLAGYKGINNVETGAQTGSGSVLISFDPKAADPGRIREIARKIPLDGGFVFFPETTAKERYWEISISGDDDQKCRELAEKLAWISAGSPLIKEQVLNFKTGSKKLTLLPDRELFAETGTRFSQAADRIRMGVYGPVVYKRLDHSGEIDVRMRTSGNKKMRRTDDRQTREGTLGIMISAGNRLDSLMQTKQNYEPASIRREDRRRTASITVSTRPMDPRRVKKALAGIFEQLELPPGYSIVFDPEAISRAEVLSGTFLLLCLAVVFCYMIIAAVNESFSIPLAVLSAVPPSLAVPALCLVISGNFLNLAAACAFIVVSGMAVNAAVLCAAGLQPVLYSAAGKKDLSLYRVLRRKIPALLATAVTTIAGALPFLVLREDTNMLVRTLSLVSALGVASSCFCAISIVPSLLFMLRRLNS